MDYSDPKSFTVWLARAIAYLAYAYLLICEFVLVQGFFLKLLGADPSASYTQWAYRSLDRVMEPFRGIFTPVELNGDAVLDTSILFAMLIYAIVALLIRTLLDWLTFRLTKIEAEREIQMADLAASRAAGTTLPPAAPPPQAPGRP